MFGFSCVLIWWREEASCVRIYQVTNPVHKAPLSWPWPHPILVSSQRPCLLILSPSGLVFRHMNLGDRDHRLKALQPPSLPSLFRGDYSHWHLYTKHTWCFVYTANKAHISRSGLWELHAQILDGIFPLSSKMEILPLSSLPLFPFPVPALMSDTVLCKSETWKSLLTIPFSHLPVLEIAILPRRSVFL